MVVDKTLLYRGKFEHAPWVSNRQDPLPDELCERLLGLIVVDDRKVCLHLV
jgi:hypothetical protein